MNLSDYRPPDRSGSDCASTVAQVIAGFVIACVCFFVTFKVFDSRTGIVVMLVSCFVAGLVLLIYAFLRGGRGFVIGFVVAYAMIGLLLIMCGGYLL